MTFEVLYQMGTGCPPVSRRVKAVIGPGDTDYPVITLMLPEED